MAWIYTLYRHKKTMYGLQIEVLVQETKYIDKTTDIV
jgi:hypothetical protein